MAFVTGAVRSAGSRSLSTTIERGEPHVTGLCAIRLAVAGVRHPARSVGKALTGLGPGHRSSHYRGPRSNSSCARSGPEDFGDARDTLLRMDAREGRTRGLCHLSKLGLSESVMNRQSHER